MKDLYFVANWKSNMTQSQAEDWLAGFKINDLRFTNTPTKEVVICPTFPLLPILKSYILNHKSIIKLGAQDISPFGEGAYTGEVNGKQIKEFADYVIIGHSERRKYFHEDDLILKNKVELALESGLTPIFCVENSEMFIPERVQLVAYEPVFAIGTGNPDTPENANEVARLIKEKKGIKYVLYGGSVSPQNIRSFTSMPNIDGVLVGGASLDPNSFLALLSQC